ncbi:hypothetical protein HHK36_023576 [Tetracentron sinense]|uniref:Uncharacterized protein n=1 Tax=Tetracentron sinense TaxID=13715 RepID=A0A834YLG8_TETSI|nr:hypothetical protein HHK36_023576 [Tetracentron sinense]
MAASLTRRFRTLQQYSFAKWDSKITKSHNRGPSTDHEWFESRPFDPFLHRNPTTSLRALVEGAKVVYKVRAEADGSPYKPTRASPGPPGLARVGLFGLPSASALTLYTTLAPSTNARNDVFGFLCRNGSKGRDSNFGNERKTKKRHTHNLKLAIILYKFSKLLMTSAFLRSLTGPYFVKFVTPVDMSFLGELGRDPTLSQLSAILQSFMAKWESKSTKSNNRVTQQHRGALVEGQRADKVRAKQMEARNTRATSPGGPDPEHHSKNTVKHRWDRNTKNGGRIWYWNESSPV